MNQFTTSNYNYIYFYYEVGILTDGIVQIGWSIPEKFQPNSESGDGVGDCQYSWSIDVGRCIKLHNGISQPYNSNDVVGSNNRFSTLEDAAAAPAEPKQRTMDIESSSSNKNDPITIVGCLWNYSSRSLSFSINGVDWGTAFQIVEQKETPANVVNNDDSSNDANNKSAATKDEESADSIPIIFPSISCNENEIVELRLYKEQFQYPPSSNVDFIAIGNVRMMTDDDGDASNDDENHEVTHDSHSPLPKKLDRTKTQKPSRCLEQISQQKEVESVNEVPDNDRSIPDSEHVNDPPVAQQHNVATLVVEPLDLNQYDSFEQLEQLGLDRLKGALMAVGVKCGGTLQERAKRLYSLKGLAPDQYPPKLLAKKTK